MFIEEEIQTIKTSLDEIRAMLAESRKPAIFSNLLFTTDQVAEILRVTPQTVRLRMQKGDYSFTPYGTGGKEYRMSWAQLQQAIKMEAIV